MCRSSWNELGILTILGPVSMNTKYLSIIYLDFSLISFVRGCSFPYVDVVHISLDLVFLKKIFIVIQLQLSAFSPLDFVLSTSFFLGANINDICFTFKFQLFFTGI